MNCEISKNCKTDFQKINYFDNHQESFFPNSDKIPISLKENVPQDIDDAFYVYTNMKRMNEKELDKLKNLDWIDYPENFKIFLFDFCILNGNA